MILQPQPDPQNAPQRFVPAKLNPLAVQHVTRLGYRFQTGNWTSQLERLAKHDFRAAIVGNKGAGKSTLLGELHGHLQADLEEASHLVSLPHDPTDHQIMVQTAIEKSRCGHVILVDGIERLPRWTQLRLLFQTRGHSGLIVNVHRPFKTPWGLPTWIHCKTSNELMHELLAELGIEDNDLLSSADRLFQSHSGNIRMVLRDLYDQIASP